MQSGSDAVLRRMRRRWGSRRFVDRCRLVREALDRPALTTDIIVGFPGETEEDFADTCRVCEEVGLLEDSHLSVQPAAHDAGGRRCRTGRAGGQGRARAGSWPSWNGGCASATSPACAGGQLEVLVEVAGRAAGRVVGTACRYAPVELPRRGRPESASSSA